MNRKYRDRPRGRQGRGRPQGASPAGGPARFLADGLAELVAPYPALAGPTAVLRTPAPPPDTAGLTTVVEWTVAAEVGPAAVAHAVQAGPAATTDSRSACRRRLRTVELSVDWRELPAERQCPDCHAAVLAAAPAG